MYCTHCGSHNADDSNYCRQCGRKLADQPPTVVPVPPTVVAVPIPVLKRAPEPRPEPPAPTPSLHSPLFALLLSALVPGAGQAYNGEPIKGFFLFFLSILAIPYLINLYDAYASAARLKRAGVSTGCSGLIWVFLQFWLAANTALLVALGLSIAGVLT